MKKIKFVWLLPLIMPLIGCASNNNVIDVARYVDSTGQKDCSDKIQELINNNPHRTLYFRDGTYLLDHQILTPGNPDLSVDLQLSNYAILKASDRYQAYRREEIKPEEKWKDQYLYMVSLGGLDRVNNVVKPGSVYSLTGGIIDGSGIAAGVEIAGGRETRIQNVSMKGVQVGIHIGWGANNGSSDADIHDVSIICNDKADSYGLKLEGHDNSVTNVRIGHVTHGVYVTGGTNILKNVHPLHNADALAHYSDSVGFEIKSFCELNNCYSDNFRTAFKLNDNRSFMSDCIAWWFNAAGVFHEQYCISCDGNKFNATVNNFVAGFRKNKNQTIVTPQIMETADPEVMSGNGSIQNIRANLLNKEQTPVLDVTYSEGRYIPTNDSALTKYFIDLNERGILPY